MAKNQLIWTEYAYVDLDGILEYVLQDNPENVPKIYDKIMAKVNTLAGFSKVGRLVPELENSNITIFREIFENPWRIIYRAEPQKVYILAVFDGRRDLEEVILKRLLHTKH
ncbi:MAG: type II toxin-antitoxin system RelE/ParE family toxin [Turneriella sp.]